MERNFTRFIFCIPFFVFFISCARGKSGECKIESDPFNKVMVDGAKIVVFDAQAEIPDYLNYQSDVEVLPNLKMAIVNTADAVMLQTLQHTSNVMMISPDELFLVNQKSFTRLKEADELTRSWGVDRVNAPVLWALGIKGRGAKIAIFDTGILPDFIDLRGKIAGMKNFTSPQSDDWLDRNGHGTSVAAIIAAEENNEFTRGIAPEAEIYIAKVIGEQDSAFASSIVRR